jgi:transglutaminase superfamily protein
MNPIAKGLRRRPHELWLFLEALFALMQARLAVSLNSFKRLTRGLGAANCESATAIPSAERAVAVEISWAVQAVARHVPLGFVCLPQALAARRMLSRRKISSTLYFGVALMEDREIARVPHAWLRTGDKIVTGEKEMRYCHAVAMFAEEAKPA